ncbi:HSP20 family protein [Hydrogenophaga taeniospiralis CCUG 15921]|uniref:HSP20 family protein n=1 Tax=Hydrogenophaga taeniospiralis CCUG 15921 TaxID=1281780 RepID=A0A9X4P8L8_9BURK|nr:Hsp20/alpha crystallin family protein [Hydrogenophaga taeniospiralis]MDG5977803.1 HSP20 family protein [Hydrogenophaga taeniospiralis CCUG 15921]
MNELSTRDPFSTDLFDDAFRNFLRPWVARGTSHTPQIKIELTESNGDYKLKADIPGVRKEDIEINIDENKVSISAEMKKESEEKKGDRVIRSERQYGYASRSFWLDSPVDKGKSTAKYQDGVLELTLPKKAPATSQRLEIS